MPVQGRHLWIAPAKLVGRFCSLQIPLKRTLLFTFFFFSLVLVLFFLFFLVLLSFSKDWSDSDKGAPNGPYKACISEIAADKTCGAKRSFKPDE